VKSIIKADTFGKLILEEFVMKFVASLFVFVFVTSAHAEVQCTTIPMEIVHRDAVGNVTDTESGTKRVDKGLSDFLNAVCNLDKPFSVTQIQLPEIVPAINICCQPKK
jgi:hypothetical protein